MLQTLPPFLFIFCLSLSGSFAASQPGVIFSSSVPSVDLGNSVKLTCKVVNFTPGNGSYFVQFSRENYYFCGYHISALNSTTGHWRTTFNNNTHRHPSLGRYPSPSSFPIYEITVTPTLAGTKEYYCDLYTGVEIHSNRLPLTVTPPSAHLTSSVSSPLLAQPFTLTCTFAHFTTPPPKYSVQFNSLRDGQLAVFEVSNGTALLSIPLNTKVDLNQGSKSAFPTFDLVITEKVDNFSAYWCALVEEGKAPVRSNTWPIKVHFSSSKPSENQRVGTCAVDATALDLSGKAYSVQFSSDLGPKSVNLLGEYIFKRIIIPALANRSEEFRSFPLPPWTSLSHGPSTSGPEFSLLANGTGSLHGTCWCVLAFGAQGTPDYREITSNKATL